MKHLRDIGDVSREEVREVWKLAQELKSRQKAGISDFRLMGKSIALVFEKPSMRTRVSFEAGATQLGAHAIYLSPQDIGLGKREAVQDIAKVISRYVDGLVVRVFSHRTVEEIAEASSVPVLNGLSDESHPCQAISDLFTVFEKLGEVEGKRLCFVGDANNVARSLCWICSKLRMEFVLSSPEGYELESHFLQKVERNSGAVSYQLCRDPREAVRGADVIYTDVWVSMGQEAEAEKRMRDLRNYQVNEELVGLSAGALVMHCLPAKRGYEITDGVLDGPQSVVLDQAENRLHIQKALLLKLIGDGE